jgi:hypothetical protein
LASDILHRAQSVSDSVEQMSRAPAALLTSVSTREPSVMRLEKFEGCRIPEEDEVPFFPPPRTLAEFPDSQAGHFAAPLSSRPMRSSRVAVLDNSCVKATSVNVLAGSMHPGFREGVAHSEPDLCNALDTPQGIFQLDANTILIADRSNWRIRQFDIPSGLLSTFAGCGGPEFDVLDGPEPIAKEAAHLYAPSSICADPRRPGHVLVFCDYAQKCIRRISPAGSVL